MSTRRPRWRLRCEDESSRIGTTTNANGTQAGDHAGKTPYYYSGDTEPGDRKGQGQTASGATGHLVNPEGNAAGAKK